MAAAGEAIGVIAGGGKLPRLLIDAIQAQGNRAVVVALRGICDPETVAGTTHVWMRLGQAGGTIDWLVAQGTRRLVMSGRVARPKPWQIWPDWRGFGLLIRLGSRMLGDNQLLEALRRWIAGYGVTVVAPLDVAPDLAAPVGSIAGPALPEAQRGMVEAGIDAARAHGQADLGQAVVAGASGIVAREDRRGTDAMLADLTDSGAARGGVLVKLPKPQQDLALDPPVVGLSTIEGAVAAGLAGVVLGAGGTLLVDRQAATAAAEAAGLFIVGWPAGRDPGRPDPSVPADRTDRARPGS